MTAQRWPKGFRLLGHPLAILFSAAFMIAAYSFMTRSLNSQSLIQIMAFQLAFTPAKAQQVLSLWSPEQSAAYLNTMWLDFLFPLGYGLFASGLLAFTLIRGQEPPDLRNRWLVAFPWVAMGCDYLENLFHWHMLSSGGSLAWLPLLAASTAAAIKWGLMGFVVLTFLALWTRRIITRLSSSSARP